MVRLAALIEKFGFQKKAVQILQFRLDKFKVDYLFPKGERDGNEAAYQMNWHHKAVLKRTGLKFRLYDCRHTFATRVLENGTDLLTLASLLGHSGLREVMRYAHPSENRKTEAIRQMQKKETKAA